MTRREILISLFAGVLGVLKFQEQGRIVFWPQSKNQQNAILDAQWVERFRLAQVLGDHRAEFQRV